MLEDSILNDAVLDGKRRKFYWLTTRGMGVFVAVLGFYLVLPVGVSYFNLTNFSAGNRLLATSIFASTLLTFSLIAVYRDLGETQAQQADIMEGQRELHRMQLNRDVREKHTEELRNRVEEWLGEKPATNKDIGEAIDQQNTLPYVGLADVQSAATGVWVGREEDAFNVAPEWLEGERYFEDLLANHANELQELKQRIEELHSEFVEVRDQFIEECEDGPRKEASEYIIEPAVNYRRWVFQQIVIVERELETKEDLFELAASVVDATAHGRENSVIFPGEDVYGSPVSVYKAKSTTGEIEPINKNRDSIEDEIVSLLSSRIENLDSVQPYDKAREAAGKLDDLDQTISKLRFKLNEYQGLPMYSGDCEYLEDELIE